MNPQQQWYDGSMAGLTPQLSEWQQRCLNAMAENGTLNLQVEALEYMVLGNNEGQVDRGADPVAALADLVKNYDLMDNQRFVERLVLRILLDRRLVQRANQEGPVLGEQPDALPGDEGRRVYKGFRPRKVETLVK